MKVFFVLFYKFFLQVSVWMNFKSDLNMLNLNLTIAEQLEPNEISLLLSPDRLAAVIAQYYGESSFSQFRR